MRLEAEAVVVDVEGIHSAADVAVPHGRKSFVRKLHPVFLYYNPMTTPCLFGLSLFLLLISC